MRFYIRCSHKIYILRPRFFDTVFFLDENRETTYDKEKEF